MKKVLIFGSFDIVHPGILFVISEAKKLGEVHAVVALDETIRKTKGRSPYYPLHERLIHLEQLGVYAYPGDLQDKLHGIKSLQPDIAVLGFDQRLFVPQLQQYIRQQSKKTKIIELDSYHGNLFTSKAVRRAMDDPKGLFLMVDKPSGQPSLTTVTTLRRLTNIKQIGFAGTLDPLASGLLVCGIGNATALLDWWHIYPKTYEAVLTLGAISETYDSEGPITPSSSEVPSELEVHDTLRLFLGAQEQQPPMHSAKKVGGTRLYELARKGKVVERKSHVVTIHAIGLVSYEYPHVRIRVQCSSGTYIRSLGHDIGQKLGTGAYVAELRRTAIGPQSVTEALELHQLQGDAWRHNGLSVRSFLSQVNQFCMPEFSISEA